MSEYPISISAINDFVFCPASIYFHSLEENQESLLFQDTCQINGTHAHRKNDSGEYSSRKSVLQGIPVYCDRYNLYGKIDTFDIQTGILTERKKKIKTIYDGYRFQLYGQYFSLTEMHYTVHELRLYSMDDNKVYPIKLPNEEKDFLKKFEQTIFAMNSFSLDHFRQENPMKCKACIYEPLCSFSKLKGE